MKATREPRTDSERAALVLWRDAKPVQAMRSVRGGYAARLAFLREVVGLADDDGVADYAADSYRAEVKPHWTVFFSDRALATIYDEGILRAVVNGRHDPVSFAGGTVVRVTMDAPAFVGDHDDPHDPRRIINAGKSREVPLETLRDAPGTVELCTCCATPRPALLARAHGIPGYGSDAWVHLERRRTYRGAIVRRDLQWQSACTDEPGDETADTRLAAHGYWAVGPNQDGSWSVALVVQGADLAEVPGTDLGTFPTAREAKDAAQRYERSVLPQ